MSQENQTTLKQIADIAHAAIGFAGLPEAEVIAAIRRLTAPYWKDGRAASDLTLDVLAALRNSKE